MRFSLRGGLLVAAFAVCSSIDVRPDGVVFFDGLPAIASQAFAQGPPTTRWAGRNFRLHGPGFGRDQSGIYAGSGPTRSGIAGHGSSPGVAVPYASPYIYTPYAPPPYPYDPSFVSPGFYSFGTYGGFVDPYSPYTVPSFGYGPSSGYGHQHFGYEYYGPGPVIDVPPVLAPPVGPVENPVQYHVANSKEEARRLREMMRNQDPDALPLPPVAPVFRPSTANDKLISLREEQAGDRDFGAGRYLQAYTHYKNAVSKAEDRAEPRAKLVVTLATIGQYPRATEALRSLLLLDPAYPHHFLSLDSIYGDSQITKESVKTQVARWALEHVANPERLMLLGALIHFDGDIARARQLFETVVLYDDLAPLIQAFLVDGGVPANGGPVIDVPAGLQPGQPVELDVLPEVDIPDDFLPPAGNAPVDPVAPPLPAP